MEGPFQLVESVIDTVVTKATPAVFLIRRVEETEKYAYYKGRLGRAPHPRQLRDAQDPETCTSWNSKAKPQTMAFFRLPCLLL